MKREARDSRNVRRVGEWTRQVPPSPCFFRYDVELIDGKGVRTKTVRYGNGTRWEVKEDRGVRGKREAAVVLVRGEGTGGQGEGVPPMFFVSRGNKGVRGFSCMDERAGKSETAQK